MAINESAVLEALSTVIDPDLGRDLVSLNMVRDVAVSGSRIAFTVVLTTPACPLKDHIRNACIHAIHEHVDPNVEVDVKMTANVTSRASADKEILPGVRNTIAVASGKGGVGKSTIAANLAVALAKSGARVGLVDTDIYGPSVPTMFGAANERPRVNERQQIIPLERYGVKLLSMGFLVDPNEAVVWRGPMVTSAVRQFLEQADWGELDYLILDLPPGTGDIQLTLVQTIPLSGAIIVTTPQEVALADARKGVAMFRKVNVPVLGIVENMAYFTPPELPDNKYFIFGEAGGKRLAQELSVPLLGEIPIRERIREASDDGLPVVLRDGAEADSEALLTMAERVAQELSIRNASEDVAIPLDIVYE
jgi:ATP-binding protein involved in chromosome partitioning